jgi:hypothetical protein
MEVTMNDLTPSERVVVRMLEAAWSTYLTLPQERSEEAMEFRRRLDEVASVVKMRPARRSSPAPDMRTQDEIDYEFDRLLGRGI